MNYNNLRSTDFDERFLKVGETYKIHTRQKEADRIVTKYERTRIHKIAGGRITHDLGESNYQDFLKMHPTWINNESELEQISKTEEAA